MHLIYELLSYALIGALLPLWVLHPKLRDGIRRRLGLYGDLARPWPSGRGRAPRIWLHGASAGDILALLPIVAELRRRAPEATLVVSAMTNSGHAIARDKLASLVDGITFLPYDLPGSTRRTLRAIQPELLVLEYTELWPNLIEAARRAGARIAMTNGRISEARLGRYRALYRLIGNPLAKLDLLLMREEVEANRALQLGASPDRVVVTGNTKFDNLARGAAPETVAALARAFGHGGEPLFVAGSTHEGEERDLFRSFRGMRAVEPRLRMLIAPRYLERTEKVLALARAEGLSAVRRSEAAGRLDAAWRPDVMVLDTMGELVAAYALATLVFVGGSFVPRGGQNILEPAGQGRPVLFGPYMMNFRDSVEVLLTRGGIQVPSPAQLERIGRELLARPEELARLGEMARAAVNKVRGASARNAELLLSLLASTGENARAD